MISRTSAVLAGGAVLLLAFAADGALWFTDPPY